MERSVSRETSPPVRRRVARTTATTGPAAAAQPHAAVRLQRRLGNRGVASLVGQKGPSVPAVQRKCACASGCAKCAPKPAPSRPVHADSPTRLVQARAKLPGSELSMEVQGQRVVPTGSAGSPLQGQSRSFMEERFGADFRDVRVHTGPSAARAADAFTTGRDIYFARGRFEPHTVAGQKLLAHELTHVLQQRAGTATGTSTRTTVGAAGDRFEVEAERNSERIVQGRVPTVAHSGATPRVQHKKAACPGTVTALKGVKVLVDLPATPEFQLTIPKEKGDVSKFYASKAAQGKLRAISDEEARQQRPGTTTLQNIWKRKTTESTFDFAKAPKGETCEIDHIVELQLSGTNVPENLQLLEPSNNGTAGSRFRGIIGTLKRDVKAACNLTQDIEDIDLIIRKTHLESGMPVDKCREAEAKVGIAGSPVDAFDVTVGKDSYEIDLVLAETASGGGRTTAMRRQLGKRGHQLITGMTLDQLTVYPGSKGIAAKDGTLTAEIDAMALLPLAAPKGRKLTLAVVKDSKNLVQFAPKPSPLQAAFPFLSETTFKLEFQGGKLIGHAELIPTLPLLRHTVIVLDIRNGALTGGVTVPPESLKKALPIPGLAVTESSIVVRLENQKLSAHGTFGFKVGTFATATLRADADKDGFNAVGTVDFAVPGLTKTKGKISYAKRQLAGEVHIEKNDFNFPGKSAIKSAGLVVHFSDRGIDGAGEVVLGIPGIKKGTLAFGIDKSGNYAVTGIAALSIPGLKSAEIGLAYRNGDLEGSGDVGLDVPGLQGAAAAFHVRYAKGALTGAGDLSYKKGKLSGTVHAALDATHKLSGRGELAYEIIPGLVAAVGMELREDGTAKISGELRIPEQLNLFPQKAVEKTIFSVGTQIPIFAIPVGPRSVGLVAEIGADLTARAAIGPGQIRHLKVKAAFDPSHEESKFEFAGGGELFVPALADLALGVHGGIGLSVGVASATGGIELRGALGLQGALSAQVQIKYQNNQFGVEAVADLSAQPVLKFGINAYVKVDVVLIGDVYRKDWNLAAKEWGSGLKIGLRFPVRYVFGKPFELSLNQVEFIVPQIDYKRAVKELLPK